ncbi:TPA: 2,3-diphosphoglycerate-dependent phosphoglycerate mutase [Raoultella ornithinolytica]
MFAAADRWADHDSNNDASHASTLILLRHGESLWNRENCFTGWTDVPLTEQGLTEADAAGKKLMASRLQPDCIHTSVLSRSVQTAWHIQKQTDRVWLPLDKSWRLNERHYGALQGLNKDTASALFGRETVCLWRRSFSGLPPSDENAPAVLQRDPRYRHLRPDELPMTESLCGALMRLMPYWTGRILPQLDEGKTVLIVSHANLLRSLIVLLENLPETATERLHVPTAVPLVYRLDAGINIISKITLN